MKTEERIFLSYKGSLVPFSWLGLFVADGSREVEMEHDMQGQEKGKCSETGVGKAVVY